MTAAATLIGVREPIILTIDNGGTNTRVARGDETIDRIDVYTTPEDYRTAIGKLGAAASQVLGGRRPDAVGFSIAGAVKDGGIVSAGKLQEYGWTGHPLVEDIAAELDVAPEHVVLLNDCVAGAEAERKARQPKPDEIGSFMTLSTGLGGALYTDKESIEDEPGHYYLRDGAVCSDGQVGHIEAHIGGAGIARKFGLPDERTNGRKYLLHGDPRWREVKDDYHESMAMTLARYEREFGISVQTMGFTGSVALGGPDMLGDLQRDLNVRLGDRAPHIEKAFYGDESGLYGAAFAANEILRAS